ncbi:MAG: 30S ribosomal protein S25e [Thermoprotei archaeon]|nr:MAG: 30S ribosomal protein S25e [Thermoprotei archaeon]
MGGKTKKSISAMEKQQKLKERKEKKGREERPVREEKRITSPLLPAEVTKQLENELNNMKCITPYALASRFGLRIGVAKSVLRQLEQMGILKCVSRNARISVYTPVTPT